VRLFTRRGLDWTGRYPSIAAAVAALSCRSCLIDDEVVICGEDGIPVFDRLRYGRPPRRRPRCSPSIRSSWAARTCATRRSSGASASWPSFSAKAGWALRFNEHIDEPGDIIFRHACKLGLEGIVSKRKDSAYRSGRSPDWLKMKNADAPAVKREAEEDWADEPFCC
jgi:bifunctional non-homologous end joining protein LigD